MSGPACTACRRAFGSAVAFCPFCGTVQRVRLEAPVPEAEIPIEEPAPPRPSPWTMPPPPRATPVRAEPPAPIVAQPRRSGWRRYLGGILLAVMLLGALITVLTPVPHGTLAVRVRLAGGGTVTAGRILIDGHPAGRPGETLDVSTGPHQVGFEEPGYSADPGTVTVQRGVAASLDLVAKELPARLSITTTPPGAAIRLMGRSWGTAPVNLEVSAGAYDVGVSLPGYVAKTVPVRLERGESRVLTVDLAAVAPLAPRFGPPPFERGVVVAGAPLLAAPGGGEVVDTLPPFSDVQVQGQVAGQTSGQTSGQTGSDESWLQVRAGARKGFVRTEAVEAWDQWAQRNTATGPVDGMTIGMRLVLAGRPYTLSGVQAPERNFSALGLARINASLASLLRGTQARCVPQDTMRFLCKTMEGRDIAEMYVLNGAALPSDGAPPYYLEARRAAQERQKGLWSSE